jgi:hypothetical protein
MPIGLSRQGQGSELAPCTGWAHLSGDAPVLAEGDAAVDLAAGRRDVETARSNASVAGRKRKGCPHCIPMLRMNWPKDQPPSILDGSWKIPSVVKAN